MAATTVSTRLEAEEIKLLESLAELSGFDRSTLIKSLLRKGMRTMRREQAVDAYRQGKVTLSRAAELGGLDLWDFIALMGKEKLDLHYGEEEFESDLRSLEAAR